MSYTRLPADLPENWSYGQTIAPTGAEAGLSTQHGYNYLMKQVNDVQTAHNALAAGVEADEGVLAAAAQDSYDGVDLTVKFADEITASPFNGDPWAWIKARLTAGNIDDLHVKDYIPFQTVETTPKTIKAQIAEKNPYLRYNDTELTAQHIDFISKDCYPENHQWNKVNYNNGISAQPLPYLASDLYHWLNALSGNVPNATTVNPATVAVDYTANGLLARMPTALKNVIVEKRALLSSRYNNGSLLTDDASCAWDSVGKLWVPSEIEVYGFVGWGTKGYSCGAFHQYDIFKDGKMRIKGSGDGGGRCAWWLLTPYSGISTYAAFVDDYGYVSYATASYTGIAVPVCFRISA